MTTAEKTLNSSLLQLEWARKAIMVPIYMGAVEPLVGFVDANKKYFHGRDGFGDCIMDENCAHVTSYVKPQHAVTAIREFCQARPQQITIIAVGPLTNLALGYTMYGEQFGQYIKELYIMGGNYQGVGNSSRSAEFNFHSDPEAAHAVLLKTRCPITILPWEPCTKERFNLSINWRLETFGKNVAVINHRVIDILTQVEKAQWLPLQQHGMNNWNPCDALLVSAWLFDKKFIKKASTWHATVDLSGTHTRGQMVIDHLKECNKFPENVCIIELVDVEFFKHILMWVAGLHDALDLK